MFFSDDGNDWRETPTWVYFLMRIGYLWPAAPSSARRLALVSMPCDSAAAGLIALGALRRRLELVDANDADSHYQRLIDSAQNKVNHVIRSTKHNGTYTLVYKDKEPYGFNLWCRKNNDPKNTSSLISKNNCVDYFFDGEPPTQTIVGEKIKFESIYTSIIDSNISTIAVNFSRTDSAICLAGRVAGELATKKAMERVKFNDSMLISDLSQLLTINGWTPDRISRICYYNSRNEKLDRHVGRIKLVIADGDSAFLKVLDAEEFQADGTSIIGVFSRVLERTKLEAIGSKIEEKKQWFFEDTEIKNVIGQAPQGIFTTFMIRG